MANTDASTHSADPTCTLEAVPKSDTSSYIYSVPNRDAPYSTDKYPPEQQVEYPYYQPVPDEYHTPPPPPKRRWKIWILWLVVGLLIAVVAGVVGGFIGKTIADDRNKDALALQQATCKAASDTTPTPTASTATSSGSGTPTPTVFTRNIPVPTTGCTPTTEQRSFRAMTNFLKYTYTTYCMSGWQSDELFALNVASPSDCVEACLMYNAYKRTDDRVCVGGGFIPEWWNQTKAMDESGGMPYNCFLKHNDTGVVRNDRVIEVVSLCLTGYCTDALREAAR